MYYVYILPYVNHTDKLTVMIETIYRKILFNFCMSEYLKMISQVFLWNWR